MSAEAFLLLADAIDSFEPSYREAVESVLARNLPLVVCTIYNANFPEPQYQRCVRVAIAVYNNVIIRVATEKILRLFDLQAIYTESEDYANAIEPSVIGGKNCNS